MSSIPPPMGNGPESVEERLDYLMLTVDRLNRGSKLTTKIISTVLVVVLGSSTAVAGWLYGRGAADEFVRETLQRNTSDIADQKGEIKEIQHELFPRRQP